MKFLRLKSNKLFYRKWPYKVTCKIKAPYLIRIHGIDNVATMSYQVTESLSYFRGINHDDILSLKEFAELANEYFKDKNIRKRIEARTVDFYIEGKDQCELIAQKLANFVTSVTEPESEKLLEYLKDNKNQIICNNYPYGKYQYKVTFRDMPLKVRNDLINWAEKYNNDDIYIKESTKIHFKGIKHKWGSHYFYVKNSKIITLISLIVAGYISRTDEYIIKEF